MTNAKTILLVDDDSVLRTGLQTLLRENGYLTLEAEDGHEAKDLIHEHRPDLVILDMMMPRWGGFAVLEHFQNVPHAPRFIMLTGHDGEKHKAYAKQIGVVDYLHKPCSIERLLQKIDQVMYPAGKVAPTELVRPARSEGAPSVLLVDVHKPLLRVLKQGLVDTGFTVDTVEDAAVADAKVREFGYDVIVLDLMLTTIDGLGLLTEWRRAGLLTEILVLAERNTTQDKVRGLDLGADDCLARPFDLQELLARLRALVRRRRQTTDTVLRVHDLEMDTTLRTVKRGGQAIQLTPREFTILHLLASHAGNVVTRAMIRDHLYDDGDDNSSNIIDVYIRYLRTKIDVGFEPKLILTRWGEGYELRGPGQ